MKKSLIVIVVIVALVLAVFGWMSAGYNSLVLQDEAVTTAWARVQTQYQRRADLVPNLVSTVKGYAKHEEETLQGVVAARAKATQVTVDADRLTPEKLAEFQKAQGELGSALGKLLAITENYPELKASEQFSELQAQLEGTENRIAKSRDDYNAAVQDYNVKVRRFPTTLLAGIFGFEAKTKFEAEAGAATAPKVSFD